MSISIIQRPEATISGETSKWNAVGNPIVYKLQRADYIVTQFQDNSGFVDVTINGIDLTADFPVSTPVIFGSDDGTYSKQSATVTAVILIFGNTHITVSTPYTSPASGGFINKSATKLNYRVQVNLYDESDVLINSEPFVYSPTASGALNVNVAGIIRKALNPNNDINFASDTVYDDVNVYKAFYIATTELYTGSAESEVKDDSNVIYAVFSALQIPSSYGGNMSLYATWDDASPKGLFLTKQDRLKMWRDYPMIVSAIVSDDVTSDVYFSVQYFDSENNIVASQSTAEDAYTGKVLEFIPNNVLEPPGEASYGRVWLTNFDDNTILIDYLYFDVITPCDNPMYLVARNSLGGVLQWMFDASQDKGFDYRNDIKAATYTLYAENTTANEWDALQDFIKLGVVYRDNITEFTASTIKTATRVGQQVYLVGSDGSKIGVLATPTFNSIQTKNEKHRFELEIEYPEEFVP